MTVSLCPTQVITGCRARLWPTALGFHPDRALPLGRRLVSPRTGDLTPGARCGLRRGTQTACQAASCHLQAELDILDRVLSSGLTNTQESDSRNNRTHPIYGSAMSSHEDIFISKNKTPLTEKGRLALALPWTPGEPPAR